jgi:hypothetical protein
LRHGVFLHVPPSRGTQQRSFSPITHDEIDPGHAKPANGAGQTEYPLGPPPSATASGSTPQSMLFWSHVPALQNSVSAHVSPAAVVNEQASPR